MARKMTDTTQNPGLSEELPGYTLNNFAETPFGFVARRRSAKRRAQKWVGILMLMCGYMSLAVSADTATDWLLIRVVGGFALLFTGFAVAISPIVASILGEDG
jgi:hypothetical protein